MQFIDKKLEGQLRIKQAEKVMTYTKNFEKSSKKNLITVLDKNFNTQHKIFEGKFKNTTSNLQSESNSHHGTHVAGIIKQVHTESEIELVDREKIASFSTNPSIINMSFGRRHIHNEEMFFKGYKLTLSKRIKDGCVLVKGAGNNNLDLYDDPKTSQDYTIFLEMMNELKRENPEKFENEWKKQFIIVGALNQKNEKAPLSNYTTNSQIADYMLYAPGQNILSSVGSNKYQEKSGTSMSTSIVSGVIGHIADHYQLSSLEARDILFDTAKTKIFQKTDKKNARIDYKVKVINVPQAIKKAFLLQHEKKIRQKQNELIKAIKEQNIKKVQYIINRNKRFNKVIQNLNLNNNEHKKIFWIDGEFLHERALRSIGQCKDNRTKNKIGHLLVRLAKQYSTKYYDNIKISII